MLKFKTRYSSIVAGLAFSLAVAACQPSVQKAPTEKKSVAEYRAQLDETLADPIKRSKMIAKILGTQADGERHAFLKFHVYGFAGDGNIIPFFTMNNYIIQNWEEVEEGEFSVEHREVAYYSEFDTSKAISSWENPFTGETIELPHFVLGPVPRYYGANPTDDLSTFASDPLNITMIGDRVYVPTLTIFNVPNQLTPEEWGPYSNGPRVFWDSMLVYSADASDVFDPNKDHAAADIHMQNLISWAPYLKMGQHPGRTMVRAYGQHISGFDDLPSDIRENLEKYTPEIFDPEWSELRMDTMEFNNHLAEQRENGTLDIDQPDYVPYEVTIPSLK